MSVGAWNVRGLCGGKKRNEVKSIIRKEKLEIIGLLETKVRAINFAHLSRTFGLRVKVITNRENSRDRKPDRIWVCGI